MFQLMFLVKMQSSSGTKMPTAQRGRVSFSHKWKKWLRGYKTPKKKLLKKKTKKMMSKLTQSVVTSL